MANVFSNALPDEDEDVTSGLRVAGALTGDGEDTSEEESPQAKQPQGTVDGSGQSYLTPAGADDGETEPPQASQADVPVSADTKAYMQPIAPPTLAKPAAFADHSADTAAMTAQKAAEAAENVKPSIGRKILAALSAGAAGFGSRNSEVGARIGQEILNGPRTNAETRWATQEAPIQAKLNADAAADAATRNANINTEQANRLAETNYSNQIRGQQDTARAQNFAAIAAAKNEGINGDGWKRDNKDDPDGSYTGTSIGGKVIHSSMAPASVRLDPEYKIDSAAAAGHPYTTEQQQIIRSGGKLTFRPPPNPRQPTEGEVSLRAATAAFTKEHGRPPQTLDEQNQVTQAAKGTLGKGGSAPTIAGFDNLLKQRTADYNLWQKNYDNEVKAARTPTQKAVVDAKYAGQQNDLQAKWNQTLSDYDPGGTLQHGGAPQQASPAGTQTPGAPPQRPAGVAPPSISPTAPPHPATHTFSVAAWQKANPKGDANAAAAAAAKQGFKVVSGFDANGKPQVSYGGGSGPPNPQ